ncbi:DUF4856 domain-containing protein [Catenovulum agarivorans]|uniref:DUF4856 domain-containing protein n=1 Tax=Catenovulum agarivorans TaxID=1172192 RepID=UPI00030BEBC9|nr:DUF4856 domain-containing protein [Catenovulum agarivorans]
MFNFKHSVIFSALALSLTACGSSSDDKNTAPYGVTLSSNTVAENTVGATVGTLSATDDQGNAVTFTLASGADANFEIDGNTLKLAAGKSLNYEPNGEPVAEIVLPIIVSDGEMQKEETIVVTVSDELDFYGFYDGNGESTVSYSGQIARHAIIAELNKYISSTLTTDVSVGGDDKTAILNKLYAFYFNPDKSKIPDGATPIPDGVDVASVLSANLAFFDNASQMSINDISTGKNLQDKIAGNDSKTDHKTWTDGTSFVAFSNTFMTNDFSNTPEGLLLRLFDKLADNAVAENALSNTGVYYVTPEGLDLQQLIQKFLLGAVAFQQGTDDYLHDDEDDKGLMSSNTEYDGKYTILEHQWDEGFGYFGAARDYLSYTDDELASSTPYMDTDDDGKINLNSEYNFGNSTNAAKRDRADTAGTDLTKDAMEAFLKGRALINANAGSALTDAQMTELKGYRDAAVLAWEQAVAATVIHYINDSIVDLEKVGTAEFSLTTLAKHWSELKGFLIGLQFNPASPLKTDFVTVNNLVGDQPVFTADGKDAYIANLENARDLMRDAYGFTQAQVAGW